MTIEPATDIVGEDFSYLAGIIAPATSDGELQAFQADLNVGHHAAASFAVAAPIGHTTSSAVIR